VLALSSSAIASPAVASEVESGVLLTVVTRPISRLEIVVGKWMGLALVMAGYAAAVSVLEVGVVAAVSGYLPPHPVVSAVYLFAESALLLTVTLLLSTRLSTLAAGVLAIALFGAAWLAGVVGSLGATFGIGTLRAIGHVSRYVLPTDGLWHGAIYYLEPQALIHGNLLGRNENPFFSLTAPSWGYLLWVAIWLVAVLAAGVVSFQRREL
jgi:ABC-type transport system involved in multi-copper enzyme maturation permease subunit